MDTPNHKRRIPLAIIALGLIVVGGCARLPRIDPTGQRIFVWPEQQAVVAGQAAPLAGNVTAPPVYTDQFLPGPQTPAPSLVPQPFGPPAVVGPPVASAGGDPTTNTTRRVPAGYLGITPERVLAPIGSEVILRGAVCGDDGYLKTHRRVEWMLDQRGTGKIVTVGNRDEWDMFRRPKDNPRKVDNNYVIGNTAPFYKCLDRGTADPSDDLQIRSGESWISVTSPVEGTSYVTAYMPSVEDWNGRTARATIYWVDAEWTLPSSTTLAPGERHTLTTTVTRQSDGTPLPGWVVRYSVTGGNAALGYDAGNSTEQTTDASGRASIEVTPTDAQSGTTTITVEVIRPAQTNGDPSPRVTLGGGDVTLTWANGGGLGSPLPSTGDTPVFTEPNIGSGQPTIPNDGFGGSPTPVDNGRADLQLQVAPAGIGPYQVGGTIQFSASLVNRGDATATINRLTVNFDPGLKHNDAEPGRQFIEINQPFTMGPGESESLPALIFNIVGAGRQCVSLAVDSDAPISPQERVCVDVVDRTPTPSPTLTMSITGPQQHTQGETAEFRIVVNNTSNVTANNVVIEADYDRQLTPLNMSSDLTRLSDGRLGWAIPAIEPSGRRTGILQFTCSESGRACCRVRTTANPDVRVTDEKCFNILPLPGSGGGITPPPAEQAGVPLTVRTAGGRVGSRLTMSVELKNNTNQIQRNIRYRLFLPAELRLDTSQIPAELGVQPQQLNNGLSLDFATVRELAAGESVSFTVLVDAIRAGNISIAAERVGDNLPQQRFDHRLEIRPSL